MHRLWHSPKKDMTAFEARELAFIFTELVPLALCPTLAPHEYTTPGRNVMYSNQWRFHEKGPEVDT